MAEHSFRARKTPIPGIGVFTLPLTRNDLLLLLVAFNLGGVGFETYLAHLISGSIKPSEAIPVFFGPLAALVILLAVFLRVRHGMVTTSTLMIIGVASLSVVVGVVGSAFHWDRALAPGSFPGGQLRWDWIVYAPPVAGPLTFAGIGLMAIIAALEDTIPETGELSLPGVLTFKTPLTQTQQLLWLVALGLFGATLSAFLDHSRTDFEEAFTWIPSILGLFGSVVTLLMALYHSRTNADYFIFFWVMMLMIGVGVLGFGLHFNADIAEGVSGDINPERFIRGAPLMAPLLFANMGILGLITMVGAEAEA
jgi:hypothetical protein